MKKIILICFFVALASMTCTKNPEPKGTQPPFTITFQLVTVPNEIVSIYYIDSVANRNVIVPISVYGVIASANPQDRKYYGDSIPTGSFHSAYLLNACENNGIRNFKIKFFKGGVTELHDLFIDFRILQPSGGFQIPEAKVDGQALENIPPVHPNEISPYDTGFVYKR